MADTQRTLAAVLALLADQTTQAISPQDLRDAVVSVFANYGLIYVHGGSTAQTGITASTLLTTFSADGSDGVSAGAVTVSKATNRLTVTVAGTYLLFFQAGFSGSVATEYHFHGVKNGSVHLNELGTHRKIGTGGDVGSCSMGALVTLAVDDYIQVFVEADSSANVTVEAAQFFAIKVG